MTDTNIMEELNLMGLKISKAEIFEELLSYFSDLFYIDKFLGNKCLFNDHEEGQAVISEVKHNLQKIGQRVRERFQSGDESLRHSVSLIL